VNETDRAVNASLFELRDKLIAKLERSPGFRSVGIAKSRGRPVFIVSVDSKEFCGDAPSSFGGYSVEIRDLGRPISHVASY
jgi:hypothetical protein